MRRRRAITTLVGTGGTRTLDAQLDNQGTLTLGQPLTVSHASGAHTNSGTIDLTAADLTLTQSGTTPSFTNTGTINVPAGRTLTLQGGVTGGAGQNYFYNGGTLGGAGTVSLLNSTLQPEPPRWRRAWRGLIGHDQHRERPARRCTISTGTTITSDVHDQRVRRRWTRPASARWCAGPTSSAR